MGSRSSAGGGPRLVGARSEPAEVGAEVVPDLQRELGPAAAGADHPAPRHGLTPAQVAVRELCEIVTKAVKESLDPTITYEIKAVRRPSK